MHTVRNRVASRPRPPRASTKGKVPRIPALECARREPSFLLRQPHPPAFPAHLILPAPRGAVISTVPWPEQAAPKPKKARKAAKRKANKGPAKTGRTAARKSTQKKASSRNKALPKSAATGTPDVQLLPEQLHALTASELLDRALAMEPELPPPGPARLQRPVAATPPSLVADDAPLPRERSPALLRGSGLLETIALWVKSLAFWRSTRREEA